MRTSYCALYCVVCCVRCCTVCCTVCYTVCCIVVGRTICTVLRIVALRMLVFTVAIHTLTSVLSLLSLSPLFSPSFFLSRSRNFDTPLHFAAFKGEADIADLLVQLGAGTHTRATTRANE